MMVNNLINRIFSSIVYEKSYNGKILSKKAPGSSIELPLIDEQETYSQLKVLVDELTEQIDHPQLLLSLKSAVKEVKNRYVKTHDGFRSIRGSSIEKVSVGDIYSFSSAVSKIFELLIPSQSADNTFPLVGIGVIAPAGQDCGKNLIKMIWQTSDYQVVDLGRKVKPEGFVKAVSEKNLTAVGVSCMINHCLENLIKVLSMLRDSGLNVPVIIGGISVNRLLAYELSERFNLNVYYGKDIEDAETVIQKALKGESPIVIPADLDEKIKSGDRKTTGSLSSFDFTLKQISISDIIVDSNARQGCQVCSGNKRKMCPLEIGFESVKTLEESRQFIRSFDSAFIVTTELPDEDDRLLCKSVWLDLLELENQLAKEYGDAVSFRLPLVCPFCKPDDCTLIKGFCINNNFYRPLHESLNINITSSINALSCDSINGICSLVLVRGSNV